MILRKEYNDTIFDISNKFGIRILIISKSNNDKLFLLWIHKEFSKKFDIIPKIDIRLDNINPNIGYCLKVYWLNVSLVTWL